VKERDVLSFGTDSRLLIDEANSSGAAARERVGEVIHGEANMVNAGTAFGDEFSDRGIGIGRLEELDEGIAGGQPSDASAIRIVEGDDVHS